MLKCESSLVTFTEIPYEITLCLNISQCPCHCRECFEPWLAEDIGTPLTITFIKDLIEQHCGITCLCFMGGDDRYDELYQLSINLKSLYPYLKIAFYSGRPQMNNNLANILDYYKVGPYIPERGPMNLSTTNQHLYYKQNNTWIDITSIFQKEKL